MLKDEIKLLKISKQHSAPKFVEPVLERELAQSDHANTNRALATKNPAQPTTHRGSLESSARTSEEDVRHITTPGSEDATPAPHFSSAQNAIKRNYASVAASKPAQAPEHPWKQVVYKNRKQPTTITKSNVKIEDQGRRILFPRVLGQQKSEADLMLALNKALQKAGEETRFCRVRYSLSGAVSALLTEKANAGLIIPRLSNVLIRAVKTVDQAIVGVEILEHWQRLKVHGMSLERYLGEGYMELLKCEVESSTGIQLKSLPRWLINENRLKEQQETGKRGSAIVITVKGEAEAKKLCASGLRFGGVVRVVERYWEAGPSSVCMTCCGIGHQRMGGCGDRPQRCVICAGPHKVEDHQCGVVGCKKGKGKLCVHVTPNCANCSGPYAANSSWCRSRHQADIRARKEKMTNKKEKEKQTNAEQNTAYNEASPSKVYDKARTKRKASPDLADTDSDTEMDNERDQLTQELEKENLDLVMESDNWAARPVSSLSPFEDNESPDSANKWD